MPAQFSNLKVIIDKDIPLPSDKKAVVDLIPWDKMKIGDSFEMPKEIIRSTLFNAAKEASNGRKKFVVRSYNNTVRCWRIK